MAKQTVKRTIKTVKITIGGKKSSSQKRCPNCGKYMGGGKK